MEEETRLLVQIRAVDSQIYVVGVPWSGVEWWLVGLSWCLGESPPPSRNQESLGVICSLEFVLSRRRQRVLGLSVVACGGL